MEGITCATSCFSCSTASVSAARRFRARATLDPRITVHVEGVSRRNRSAARCYTRGIGSASPGTMA